ncbi:phosphatase PAP2/dual specificity phosphatase family protein [Massilia sp. S19_KUP03_FR1]|uniref:phosphatase PAP2/dual specificity phosphatase family protein n=1 Tax=Massilia sp. S19_KUP03_FR1 TaxID=3025503 RepID=UPI002FCD9EAA
MTNERLRIRADQLPLPPGPKPNWLAPLLLAGMGALFFTSYAWSNWLASQRVDIPSLYFAWERHIPFIPWTILPYWSIDFFYAGSFFLWSTRAMLLTHAKRLLAAQLISVACFVAFPLRFAFEHPPAHGWAGTLFTLLGGFDKPFNQAPSLHISLLLILWVAYAARARGGWRWLLHGWFALIGVSVLTTYQHHFIDVPSGWLAGCLCVFAFPLSEPTGRALRCEQTRRIARCYGIGAAAMALLSLAIVRDTLAAGLLLAWTALALACVAQQYHAGRPDGLGKQADGTFPMASWCLLAPYLCGAFFNARWWTRGQPGASRVAEGLWLGRFPTAAELRRTGANAVLDLTAELPRLVRPSVYRCIPVLDLTVPSESDLRVAVDTIHAWQADGRTVLVCCALGYSRSALVAAAWLADQSPQPVAPSQLLAQLRAARPGVTLGPRSMEGLAAYMSTKRNQTEHRPLSGVDDAI